ncbi:MAG: CvpA family protein [Cellulosilyticum sp.]|nr:CvpA family protein [Cellulosilyticum sp.]
MIDLIILVIILIFALIGYKKGLIKEIITLVSSIMALVVAFIIYPAINAILKVTALYTVIYSGVLEKVQIIDFGKGLQSQGKAIIENITWLPSYLTEQIASNNNTAMYEMLGVHTIQEYISTYITDMIIGLIAILVTWFLIKVALVWVLRIMGSIIEHLPIISGFNHIGGLIVGIFKGALTLSIIVLIVPLFITIPSLSHIGESLEMSYLVRWFYENNLVIWLYNYFIQ